MTSTAFEKIKEINKIKREIVENNKKIDKTRNIYEYKKLIVISENLHIKLKHTTEDLLSSINNTIELNCF
jgi:hypothetical protein